MNAKEYKYSLREQKEKIITVLEKNSIHYKTSAFISKNGEKIPMLIKADEIKLSVVLVSGEKRKREYLKKEGWKVIELEDICQEDYIKQVCRNLEEYILQME